MSNKLTAEQTLVRLIETIEISLTELLSLKHKNEFVVGEWYAFVECIEVVTSWDKAEENGLNYNPEIKFNII